MFFSRGTGGVGGGIYRLHQNLTVTHFKHMSSRPTENTWSDRTVQKIQTFDISVAPDGIVCWSEL